MINAIVFEQIKKKFAEQAGDGITDVIFDQLSIQEEKDSRVITLLVDDLSWQLLYNNNKVLLNVLWEIIKKNIGSSRNWDLWKFEISKRNAENEIQEKELFYERFQKTNLNKFLTFTNYFSKADNAEIINISNYIIDHFKSDDKITTFYIYGRSGYGKTHVVNAIGNKLFEENSKSRILYTTGSDFLKDYTSSFKDLNAGTKSFDEKYDNLDALIIDDFQFIEAKEQTLNTFFEIFDKMRTKNKYVILASDKDLNDLDMPERIISRIKDGNITKINKPDKETRISIFKYHFENSFGPEYNISEDAINLVCETITSPREIIGLVKNLLPTYQVLNYNKTQQTNNCIGFDEVQKIIDNTYKPKKLTHQDIVEIVCNKFKVNKNDVLRKNTRGIHKTAGNFIIYFLSTKLKWEQMRISKLFKLNDHSSISKRLKAFENEDKIKYKDAFTQISCEISRKHSE